MQDAKPTIFTFHEQKHLYAYKINNEYWFVARYVSEILEYQNPSQTIKMHCKQGGVLKKYLPTSSGFQEMTLINRDNLLRLIMRSKMKEAITFQEWVIEKVLPSILDTGKYSSFENVDNTLSKHLDVMCQKQNSKNINGLHFNNGGMKAIKEYNILNCTIHTGMTPKDIKEMGKKMGLKSKNLTSAKQVLRNIKPEIACTMSFADTLLQQNPSKTLNDISQVTLKAISVYDEMLKAGIIPIELQNN
jgi:prophage antirepressor-like protein